MIDFFPLATNRPEESSAGLPARPPAATNILPTNNMAAVIGNFDGFHRGHGFIINQLLAVARKSGQEPWLITFAPHPKIFFDPAVDNFLLTTTAEKIALAAGHGLHGVAVVHFNQQLANLTADQFVAEFLIKKLAVGTLLVGRDFRFGKGRQGDVTALRAGGIGRVVAVDLATSPATNHETGQGGGDTIISSSAIREKITAANLPAAATLLGRPFAVTEKIIHGDKTGRLIGFPTANLDVSALRQERKILPPHGIYGVTARLAGGDKIYLGSCYHGVRAGLDKTLAERLEVHLFNFTGDIYGQTMTVEFHHFVRGDKKIDNLPDLQKQISADNAAIQGFAVTARP